MKPVPFSSKSDPQFGMMLEYVDMHTLNMHRVQGTHHVHHTHTIHRIHTACHTAMMYSQPVSTGVLRRREGRIVPHPHRFSAFAGVHTQINCS